MSFEIQELKNQAKVYYVPLKSTHSVTVLIMYPVGSRYESARMSGVSHFIEHLMFKGTKKRKNTLALTREIDRLGAEYNAFTGKEYTGYFIKSDSSYVTKSLDILSDMLFDSLFTPREMEREKTVIAEEIKMYNDNPLMSIDTVFEGLLYEGALGRDIAGEEKNVLSFKREDTLAYKEKFYQPRNMTIVVAGNFDDKIKKEVENYFGERENKQVSKKSLEAAILCHSSKDKRIIVRHKATDQAQLMLGFPAFSYKDKRNDALGLLNSILGGSMSSRLFIKIRERRGLAYMVRSGQEKFIDTGYSFVRAGLDAKNINQALKVISQELKSIKSKGVTSKELKDAKTRLRGSLALDMEDSSAVASFYANQAMFKDEIKTVEERVAEFEQVTEKDIKKVAQEVFSENKMRVAVIGEIEKNKIKF